MNPVITNSLGLKYPRFTLSGIRYQDIGIRKFKFVTNTRLILLYIFITIHTDDCIKSMKQFVYE